MSNWLTSVLRDLLPAVLLGLLNTGSGQAAVFYVDPEAGRDTWTGRAPDPRGSPLNDGPWASLARVASHTFVPGDEIRLRCGRQWSETLRINQSGTAAAPIIVGAYPASPCEVRPMIRGGARIPAHAWVPHQGNAYRASWPVNLVENGSLSQSITKWTRWSVLGGESLAFNPSCTGNVPCLDFTSAPGQWSLVISPKFRIDAGNRYTATFAVLAPRGTNLVAIVRRGGPTNYDSLGLSATFAATGTWQTQSFSFTSTQAADNARLDLYVAGNRVRLQLRDVRVHVENGDPVHIFLDDRPVQRAHHPNFGHDPSDPSLIYLRNAVDSDRVASPAGNGSTFLTTGPDLKLPPGATLSAGLIAHMRTSNWTIDRRTVTAVNRSRLTFAIPTSYQFQQSWGYFLTGAAWMVDSPDEWHFDATTRQLLAWMPDGLNPAGRVSYAVLRAGVNLDRLSHVIVDGIAITGTTHGVTMRASQSVTVRNVRIEDILEHGVAAIDSSSCVVERSEIEMTGLDAVAGGETATRFTVQDNRISSSGVLIVDNRLVSLPAPAFAAIRTGPSALILRNSIDRTAYHGIRAHRFSAIRSNSLSDTCLMLDDCAGIYNYMTAMNTIADNVVRDTWGNRSGTPHTSTHAVGIYLDDLSSGLQVRNNTVTNADHGIQLHNAYDNIIVGNTLYGNRRLQLWFQEQTRTTRVDGDIRGNRVEQNVLVSTTGGTALLQESELGSTTDFAAYSGNTWSALASPRIVSESWPGGGATYTFPQWRAATIDGVSRNLDMTGSAVEVGSFAAFRVLGGNVVSNGDLTNGTTGWTWWNRTPPAGQLFWERCAGVPCLRFVAGASESLLSSPNFSVIKDQWYRVSFDARTPAGSRPFAVVARRGGGGTAGYEDLMASSENFVARSDWARYSFAFKAGFSVTANDPVTRELGARIDFHRIASGESLLVMNVEMVPISPADASVRTALLLNPDPFNETTVGCPDASTAPQRCTQYLSLKESAPISWPLRLPALGSAVVYSRDETLVDSDRDGIADLHDRCPNTMSDAAVRANGCSLQQTPQ